MGQWVCLYQSTENQESEQLVHIILRVGPFRVLPTVQYNIRLAKLHAATLAPHEALLKFA